MERGAKWEPQGASKYALPENYCILCLCSGKRYIKIKKGGKARAEKLSPERRKEIARKAAKARWDKKRREEESS